MTLELPRIGIRLPQELDPHGAIELAVAAEASGFAALWFADDRVALHFRAPRPEMPIYLASMGDRSLELCGRLADGLIVSNMRPPGYSERAVGIVQGSAANAGRPPLAVVQYVPCAARPDRAAA